MKDFDWDNCPEDFDNKAKLLFQHICWSKENLEPVPPKYVIVWQRPDGNTSVTTPAPEWMAMAMHGGLLPDIEVYHRLRCEWTNDAGETILTDVKSHPGPQWKTGRVTNGWLLHIGPRAPAMTEEEAMEYLLQKDVPLAVWADHETANQRRFIICPKELIPTDRTWRDAWVMKQEELEDA